MSFDEIYTHNYRMVYLLAYRMVRDEEASKDIAQDVFIKLHNSITGGTRILNPEGWLRRITYNHCINHIRDCKKTLLCNSLPHDLFVSGVDVVIAEEEERAAIRNAIDRMKIEERLLLMLYSEGMSYREISEASGIPYNSVGSTLSRTLKKLKKIYYEKEKTMSGR